MSCYYLMLVLLAGFPYCGFSAKCYICEFNAAYCHGVNCYNNPDLCSSNQFSTALVPVKECPHNCFLKAISNPAGMVIKWIRDCAPASDLSRGFRCRTDFTFGARIDQCTCDKDFCNHTSAVQVHTLIVAFCLISSFGLYRAISV